MAIFYQRGGPHETIDDEELGEALRETLARLGPRRRVLAVPPDFTRASSRAGLLTRHAHAHYGDALVDVLPALGTHAPMADWQVRRMFEGIPPERIRVHDWRRDVVTIGEIPGAEVATLTEGVWSDPWPAQLNRNVRLSES